MSVLTDTEIRQLVEDATLIENFDSGSLQGASYDMRLGAKYASHGEIHSLTDESPSYVLQPGEFIILTSFEALRMPLDLIGHNGIMSPWAQRGIVSLFSPQIDPGFVGFLTVPIFNAGDAPITLILGERIFTIEFVRTSTPASYSWSGRFGEQRTIRISATPSVSRPNLTDISNLSTEVEALRKSIANLQQTVLHQEQLALRSIEALTSNAKQKTVELESKLQIIENRVNDGVTRRQLNLSRRQVNVGIFGLIVAVGASTYVDNVVFFVIQLFR